MAGSAIFSISNSVPARKLQTIDFQPKIKTSVLLFFQSYNHFFLTASFTKCLKWSYFITHNQRIIKKNSSENECNWLTNPRRKSCREACTGRAGSSGMVTGRPYETDRSHAAVQAEMFWRC